MSVIGGFGVLTRLDAIDAVKAALADVEGIESIEAPGNVPNIALMKFSSAKLIRDFVHVQKSHAGFGLKKMWASPDQSPHERKFRLILNKIKRGICEHLQRSSESIVIDGPNRSVYSIEANRLLKVTEVSRTHQVIWSDSVADLLKMHVQLLMADME